MTPAEMDQLVERIASRTIEGFTQAVHFWVVIGISSYVGYKYLGWWWCVVMLVVIAVWDMRAEYRRVRIRMALEDAVREEAERQRG